ncbi:MAG: hypothetical protein KKD64_03190 [Alphaproteobacteria bacterium]|nr:hypothetical protein [Alphaproteobacteria bacterium]MBU0874785.1 hypothetical protein [Alphaproteobacteria bacterium]MBU1768643.1 hypothetical protein [Alphaproteobacteria bacterium]
MLFERTGSDAIGIDLDSALDFDAGMDVCSTVLSEAGILRGRLSGQHN